MSLSMIIDLLIYERHVYAMFKSQSRERGFDRLLLSIRDGIWLMIVRLYTCIYIPGILIEVDDSCMSDSWVEVGAWSKPEVSVESVDSSIALSCCGCVCEREWEDMEVEGEVDRSECPISVIRFIYEFNWEDEEYKKGWGEIEDEWSDFLVCVMCSVSVYENEGIEKAGG